MYFANFMNVIIPFPILNQHVILITKALELFEDKLSKSNSSADEKIVNINLNLLFSNFNILSH